MTYISWLPTVNAIFNASSFVLLVSGYLLIKRGHRDLHRAAMLGATFFSLAFLISYLWYHYNTGSQAFTGAGFIRPVYFTILLTHTVLAVTNLPLVIITLRRGLRGDFERHRPLARITLPIWIYVSVTGVVIYFMLYRIEFAG